MDPNPAGPRDRDHGLGLKLVSRGRDGRPVQTRLCAEELVQGHGQVAHANKENDDGPAVIKGRCHAVGSCGGVGLGPGCQRPPPQGTAGPEHIVADSVHPKEPQEPRVVTTSPGKEVKETSHSEIFLQKKKIPTD